MFHSEFILNLNWTKHISSYRLVSPLFVDKLLTLFIFLFLFCDTLVDWLSRVVIVTKMIASFSNLWSSVFKICKRSLYFYIHALCFHYFYFLFFVKQILLHWYVYIYVWFDYFITSVVFCECMQLIDWLIDWSTIYIIHLCVNIFIISSFCFLIIAILLLVIKL